MSHSFNITKAGIELEDAGKAVIMLHGRGASAQDILQLTQYLNIPDFAALAPQATNHSWYPHSFLARPQQNEPWLSSAIDIVTQTVSRIVSAGIEHENIYFVGFSQGACVALEYVARHAKRYGGVAAFTGGLIGDEVNIEKYQGDFRSTPIFIGTGDPDAHVPLARVHESAQVLQNLMAEVTVKVFEGRPHSISQEEIEIANRLIFT